MRKRIFLLLTVAALILLTACASPSYDAPLGSDGAADKTGTVIISDDGGNTLGEYRIRFIIDAADASPRTGTIEILEPPALCGTVISFGADTYISSGEVKIKAGGAVADFAKAMAGAFEITAADITSAESDGDASIITAEYDGVPYRITVGADGDIHKYEISGTRHIAVDFNEAEVEP